MSELLSAITAAYTVLEKALPSIFIGLFLANLMSNGGGSTRANQLLPLVERLTGLPRTAVLVMLLSLADRTAGMVALEAARKQFDLADRQVIAINLAAKAPAVTQFFIFSFIPLMVALFPRSAAIRFLAGYFAAFIMISIIGVVLLKLWSDRRLDNGAAKDSGDTGDSLGTCLHAVEHAFRQTLQPFIRIAVWMFSMSAIVMLLVKSGALLVFADVLSLSGGLIGVNVIPLIGAGLISMIGGVAAVGAAWQEGILDPENIVPLLFLISIAHNIYDLFASSLPRTIAVFGRNLGVKVGIAGFFVTEGVMLLFFILAL
ncbi:hypothetical protein [Sporomusa malonica]|uniref:Nucleoside recognition n=1 Tax=Sporomusa malonica TaxID=112901 RepID=A0A1W1YHP4_9FIRM|nr:hypothetical protein [Sporomusa malonica]SMC35642.1 hypothetical protein SAMN04488500_101380 [Sporomusa malonica]